MSPRAEDSGASATGAAAEPRWTGRRWALAAKMTLVVCGLGLLLHWTAGALPDRGAESLRSAAWAIAIGALLNQAALLVAALRLRATLAAFAVHLTPGQALSIHLRSLFYFFFVPFSVGLELSRYLYIRRLAPAVSGPTLLLALLLDRVLGLVAALGALIGFAAFVVPTGLWQQFDPRWLALASLLVLLAGAAALLHRGVRGKALELLRAMATLSFRLVWPTLLSFVALALVCGSVYVVAAAAAWAVGPGQVVFALSASLLGMAVPVSLFGATLGEVTGAGVLALLGITPAVAILLVTLGYTWRLFSAMQGALLELLDGLLAAHGAPRWSGERSEPEVDMGKTAARDQTIADFGEQWLRYRDNTGYYASLALFEDIVAPLLTPADVAGRRVADVGSGTGRIVAMLLAADAASVTAIEPSRAFEVLVERFADEARVRCHQVAGEDIANLGPFELVTTFGVLHHIPEPLPVVRAIHEALAPGGRLFAWIYGREGNGLYLALAQPIRQLTRRLPDPLLRGLVRLLDVPLAGYIWLCHRLPLPMGAYMREHLGKLGAENRRLTIFDQLNPTYAKYYRRDEAEALFAAAGFTDIRLHHRHGYSWSILATRSPAP